MDVTNLKAKLDTCLYWFISLL